MKDEAQLSQRGMGWMETMLVLPTSIPGHKPGHNENTPGAAVDGCSLQGCCSWGAGVKAGGTEMSIQLLLFAFMAS